MSKISIIIVDDHEIVRDGISLLLSDAEDIEMLAEYEQAEDFISADINEELVVIMDIDLPGINGIEAIKKLKRRGKPYKYIVYSGYTDDAHLIEALEAGVQGLIPKNSGKKDLLNAIVNVAEGGEFISPSIISTVMMHARESVAVKPKTNLSKREVEIVQNICEGLSYKEIGARLFISTRTVETHKNNILKKLELKTVIDLVKYAIRNGIYKL